MRPRERHAFDVELALPFPGVAVRRRRGAAMSLERNPAAHDDGAQPLLLGADEFGKFFRCVADRLRAFLRERAAHVVLGEAGDPALAPQSADIRKRFAQ